MSFLLGRLLADKRPAWRHARMIDRERIGMAGHSIGGASAATIMASDPRVRAGPAWTAPVGKGRRSPLANFQAQPA
ncbi:hypothetical protein ACFWV1_25725 [Streptomyces sp. NPDC058700]|uniref:hypothetical protein n=1 Tax=unclassified Streptomyces TaxID=2593676 RepID=UPI003665B027